MNEWSWYRFEEGNPKGIPRIQEYVVGFYENGKCYDEARYKPEDVALAMPYLMRNDCKVFAVFGKDEVYELVLRCPQ